MRKHFIALAFATCTCLFGQIPDDVSRLEAVGRLWVTVNYFHPYIAEGKIDWDAALVHALPAIRAAKTSDEYARALQSMLDALHDPATYISKHRLQSNAQLNYRTEANGTLVISQTSGKFDLQDIDRLRKAIQQAGSIVFDLRGYDYLSYLLDLPAVANELTPVPLDAPPERTWVHHGLPAHYPIGSAYYSAFETKAGRRFPGDPASKRHQIEFLLGEQSRLPLIASALAAAGQATIRAESPHYAIASAEAVPIDMGGNVEAAIRLSEPATLPASPSVRPDRDYANPTYPAAEYRILAAYKVWGAFHYFFAYRDQMDDDWDADFKEFLPKIASAQDALAYNLAISEFVTHVHDSHAQLFSDTLLDYFGPAPVGLRLRLIEKRPVVTEVVDEAAKKAGIQPGDIVLKIDGERVSERANREARYIPASTQQSLAYLVLQRVLNGPDASMATLTIEGRDGQIKEVKLRRSRSFAAALRYQRTGDIVKILPGNIGYVDLDRLKSDQVDSMFNQLRNTKAIIFDMRGYPSGTAFEIAPRLTNREDVPAALFTGPLTLAPDLPYGETLTQNASYFFVQRLPGTDKPRYLGKTVMLIDERAISAAEHTGLLFEAANGTKFIGTPSAGANGDITSFVVPGGITIHFSGHDVRHANGGQLQRLGLQPNIEVAPTIAGIRAGRDEVLKKAIEYLSETN